jgi:uncharacterized protein (DUF2132 family)
MTILFVAWITVTASYMRDDKRHPHLHTQEFTTPWTCEAARKQLAAVMPTAQTWCATK